MIETRVEQLETKLMYQEQLIDELNAVVTRQNREIQQLITLAKKLSGQVDSLMPLLNDKSADDEPPPHY